MLLCFITFWVAPTDIAAQVFKQVGTQSTNMIPKGSRALSSLSLGTNLLIYPDSLLYKRGPLVPWWRPSPSFFKAKKTKSNILFQRTEGRKSYVQRGVWILVGRTFFVLWGYVLESGGSECHAALCEYKYKVSNHSSTHIRLLFFFAANSNSVAHNNSLALLRNS